MADIAASVLARLKNKAKASGISYQQCLQLFFQEEFLRKLAASRYRSNFVLKGGLFIYTLTNFESRATVDVDFMLPEFISFYQLKNALAVNELQLIFEEQTFGEVVDTVCALSPLFTDKERESFLLTAADALNASIENLCDGVDADDYSCDVGSAVRRATDYGYESAYAEVDEDYAAQLIDEDIESTVNADIRLGILSLPKDLQAIMQIDEHYKVTVDGAEALVQQYLDEDDYEVEFEEAGEQLDEIDTIFCESIVDMGIGPSSCKIVPSPGTSNCEITFLIVYVSCSFSCSR